MLPEEIAIISVTCIGALIAWGIGYANTVKKYESKTCVYTWLLLMISSLIDGLATLTFIHKGGEEFNPLMETLILLDPALFLLTKGIMTGIGVWFLLKMSQQYSWAKRGIFCILFLYWIILVIHIGLLIF